jgi:hypothetical protein
LEIVHGVQTENPDYMYEQLVHSSELLLSCHAGKYGYIKPNFTIYCKMSHHLQPGDLETAPSMYFPVTN